MNFEKKFDGHFILMRVGRAAKTRARGLFQKSRALWASATQPLVAPWIRQRDHQRLEQIKALTRIRELLLPQAITRGCERLVLFSHYSARGHLQRCIKRELQDLRQADWQILLISDQLDQSARQWCQDQGLGIMIRINEGRDFGAFQDGWLNLKAKDLLTCCKQLILLNDSVYPIINLAASSWPRFLNGDPEAVVGITDSYENGYHLQSYALHLPQAVIEAGWWNNYWRDYPGWGGMRRSIRSGEIGLSQLILQHGIPLKPLHSVVKLRFQLSSERLQQQLYSLLSKHCSDWILQELLSSGTSSISNFSPTHSWSIPLILDGCPFIKRQLLENNEERYLDPLLVAGGNEAIVNPEELVDYLKPPILYLFG